MEKFDTGQEYSYSETVFCQACRDDLSDRKVERCRGCSIPVGFFDTDGQGRLFANARLCQEVVSPDGEASYTSTAFRCTFCVQESETVSRYEQAELIYLEAYRWIVDFFTTIDLLFDSGVQERIHLVSVMATPDYEKKAPGITYSSWDSGQWEHWMFIVRYIRSWLFRWIAAHEIIHTWQKETMGENGKEPEQVEWIEEGFPEWVAYKYLQDSATRAGDREKKEIERTMQFRRGPRSALDFRQGLHSASEYQIGLEFFLALEVHSDLDIFKVREVAQWSKGEMMRKLGENVSNTVLIGQKLRLPPMDRDNFLKAIFESWKKGMPWGIHW